MDTKDQQHPSPIDVDLRPPTDGDLDAIQAGWDRAVPHDSLGNWAQSAADLVYPPEEAGVSRVATLDGKIIGFASAIGGALRTLYVEDTYRQQGVGGRLLADIVESARARGWEALGVVTLHDWTGTIPGIDSRYDNAVRFLERRGFARKGFRYDNAADLEEIETAARQRPLPGVCAVAPYHPDALAEMQAFDERAETHWNWVQWIEKFPQTAPDRVRLIARAEGQLVGCGDAKLSGSVAGLAYIYVDTAYRRRGIGSVLLREIAREAKRRGAASVFAGDARRVFYEANGFRTTREFVEMAKPLS